MTSENMKKKKSHLGLGGFGDERIVAARGLGRRLVGVLLRANGLRQRRRRHGGKVALLLCALRGRGVRVVMAPGLYRRWAHHRRGKESLGHLFLAVD